MRSTGGGIQENRSFVLQGGVQVLFFITLFLSSLTFGQLTPADVLLLVNAESPTSRYIAKMYRQYHPQIAGLQVLQLAGLPDSSGPAATAASEIITRQQYEQLIAQPVRNYLIANNLAATIKVIITTAGMPYRIEDTNYPNVIYPAGSNPTDVSTHLSEINAASVESELTCLWHSDYGQNPFGIDNRMVNPYQGYRQSSITLFNRAQPGAKQMLWTTALAVSGVAPKMEGQTNWEWPNTCYGTFERSFNPGDFYLTCRLDGPKNQGQTAVFSVRKMLERAKLASSPASGVNPLQAVAVLDDAPSAGGNLDRNRVYNLDASVNYVIYQPDQPQPPGACAILIKDDFVSCYTAMTNGSLNLSSMNYALSGTAAGLCVILDRRSGIRTCQSDLDALLLVPELQRQGSQGIAALACFGQYSGDENTNKGYLLTGGPAGGPLFKTVNGAVFDSIESFNAVTMFSDAVTTHAKIVDFITIGGCGAIGHSFEPMSDSIEDNLYFFYNLFADENGDGFADLSFVEAAFTGLPYLSWSEVAIGDPLMRIAYGPGGFAWNQLQGDCNNDGFANVRDVRAFSNAQYGVLNTTDQASFDRYNDLCDLNKDGYINTKDVRILQDCLY